MSAKRARTGVSPHKSKTAACKLEADSLYPSSAGASSSKVAIPAPPAAPDKTVSAPAPPLARTAKPRSDENATPAKLAPGTDTPPMARSPAAKTTGRNPRNMELFSRLVVKQLALDPSWPLLSGPALERLKQPPTPRDLAHAFAGTPTPLHGRKPRPAPPAPSTTDVESQPVTPTAAAAEPPDPHPFTDATSCILVAVKQADSYLSGDLEVDMPHEQVFILRAVQTMFHWLCGAHKLLTTAQARTASLERTVKTQSELIGILFADPCDMADADIESLVHTAADVRDVYYSWHERLGGVQAPARFDKPDLLREVWRLYALQFFTDAVDRSHLRAVHSVYEQLSGPLEAGKRARARVSRLESALDDERKKSTTLADENAALKAELEALKVATGAADLKQQKQKLVDTVALLEKAEGAVYKAECKIARLEERVRATEDEVTRVQADKLKTAVDMTPGTYAPLTPTTPAPSASPLGRKAGSNPIAPTSDAYIKTSNGRVDASALPDAASIFGHATAESFLAVQELFDDAAVKDAMARSSNPVVRSMATMKPLSVPEMLGEGLEPVFADLDIDDADDATDETARKPAVTTIAAPPPAVRRAAPAQPASTRGPPDAPAPAVPLYHDSLQIDDIPLFAGLGPVVTPDDIERVLGGGDCREAVSRIVEKIVTRGCTCDDCTRWVQSGMMLADLARDEMADSDLDDDDDDDDDASLDDLD